MLALGSVQANQPCFVPCVQASSDTSMQHCIVEYKMHL